MSDYGIDIYSYDFLQGGAQLADQTAQQAVANVSTLATTGTLAQIVGFDAGGNPMPKNVSGDSNGAGLAFSGDTLTASLPQDLKTSGSPSFTALTVTNQATVGDLRIGTGPIIKQTATGTISIDPGVINGHSRGFVDVTITGAAVGDIVIMQPPSGLDTALMYGGCVVTGADTVRVFIGNLANGNVNDGAQTWVYLWMDIT